MIGTIYKLTSPSGKHYIGQTMNLKDRKRRFYNPNNFYSGHRLDNAIKKYGVENFKYEILVQITDSDKIKLREKLDELEIFYIKKYNSYKKGYNMTLESYITQNGMTEDQFKKSVLENEVYPLMDEVMPLYAIIDKEKIEITADAIDEKLEEIIALQGDSSVTAGELKEYYGEFYFESMVARDLALKFVKEKVKIK